MALVRIVIVACAVLLSAGLTRAQEISDAEAYRQYAGRLSVPDFKAIKAAIPALAEWKVTPENFRKIRVARDRGELVVIFYQRDFADDPNLGLGSSARGKEELDIEVILDPANLRILKSYIAR